MTSNYTARAVIEAQARALGPVLHSGMAVSLSAARRRMRGLEHARYPHLLPLTMRAEFRQFLEREPIANGWNLGGDSRAMGQLLLQQPDLGLEMRFVKERRRATQAASLPQVRTTVAGSGGRRTDSTLTSPMRRLQ